MLGIVSKSLAEWFKENKIDDANYVKAHVPVNLRRYPTNPSDVILGNQLIINYFRMPIIEDLSAAVKESRKEFYKNYRNELGPQILTGMNLFHPLPTVAIDNFATTSSQGINIGISNLDLSSEPWYICGQKVGKRAIFANCVSHSKFIIEIVTYEDKMNFSMNLNKYMKMDYRRLLEIMASNIKLEFKNL